MTEQEFKTDFDRARNWLAGKHAAATWFEGAGDMSPKDYAALLSEAMLGQLLEDGATVDTGADWRPSDGVPEDYYAL